MASDLLNIASSGLLAQQKMLATTSNNISNVSTQGYVRQNTILYSNPNSLGVGDSVSRRLYSVYAQSQVWQDTAVYNQVNTVYTEASQLDKYLSNSATSVSDGLDSFFSGLQSANSSPNTTANRQDILTQISSMADTFKSVSSAISDQYEGINNKISTETDGINSLLSSVSEINQQILKIPEADDDGTRANLLDQRDEFIRQLSAKIDIRTVAQDNGTVQINLSTGQSLVMVNDYAKLSVIAGDPDTQNTNIAITLGNATTQITGESVGSSFGGYFEARDIITDAQKELGQLSLAFADAMNTQNKMGMTLNNTIGSDIYTLPVSTAKAYGANTGSGGITASVISGSGSNISPDDFFIEFTGSNSYEVFLVDGKTKTSLMTGSTPPDTFELVDSAGNSYGLEFTVSGSPAAGDRFLLQPTIDAAENMSSVIASPEDLALASPLQFNASASNYGSAKISQSGIYNTGTGSAFTQTSTSPVQGTLDYDAPAKIVFQSPDQYDLYRADDSFIGSVNSSDGQDLLMSYYGDATTYPGYDIDIDGNATSGDTFYISFNTDGFSDNTNGLSLAALQTKDLVRKGNSSAADNKMTFSEAFSATLTQVGTTVSSLKITSTAAEAKLTQSQELYESVAGVNLDEEASNLIRYQQAYSACAQVISTARDTFDTLLSAVG